MTLIRKSFPLLLPVGLGLVLIVCGFFIDRGTGGSDVQPAPAPGQHAILHVQNHGDSLRFDDHFGVEVWQKAKRPLALREEPRPLPCRFTVEILKKNSVRGRHAFDELSYAGEYPAGRSIFFRSQLFDLPAGESIAKIGNIECTASVDFQHATVSITPVGEHLLGPIVGVLLRWIGYILIASSAVAALLIFARSKSKSPKNQSQD